MVCRRATRGRAIGGLRYLAVALTVTGFMALLSVGVEAINFYDQIGIIPARTNASTSVGVSEVGALLLLGTALAVIAAATRRRMRSRKHQS